MRLSKWSRAMFLLECCGSEGSMLQRTDYRWERFFKASTATTRNQSVAQRRHALLERDFQFEGVFGDSPRLIEALEIAEKAARTDLPVLVDGESGTGKELMAKVI